MDTNREKDICDKLSQSKPANTDTKTLLSRALIGIIIPHLQNFRGQWNIQMLSTVYSDLKSYNWWFYVNIEVSKTAGGGIMLPEAAVTDLKPDFISINRKAIIKLFIYVLTVSNE